MSALYETSNDLPEKVRTQVVELLNERLADAIDLATQTKQAHVQAPAKAGARR
jgi:starvation-inducible DNA-binding protein